MMSEQKRGVEPAMVGDIFDEKATPRTRFTSPSSMMYIGCNWLRIIGAVNCTKPPPLG